MSREERANELWGNYGEISTELFMAGRARPARLGLARVDQRPGERLTRLARFAGLTPGR